ERYHRSMKNRILLDNYYLPGQLEQSIEAFVEYYNDCRYHESLDNPTPADVYFGRGQAILERREKTIEQRRRLHHDLCFLQLCASLRARFSCAVLLDGVAGGKMRHSVK